MSSEGEGSQRTRITERPERAAAAPTTAIARMVAAAPSVRRSFRILHFPAPLQIGERDFPCPRGPLQCQRVRRKSSPRALHDGGNSGDGAGLLACDELVPGEAERAQHLLSVLPELRCWTEGDRLLVELDRTRDEREARPVAAIDGRQVAVRD